MGKRDKLMENPKTSRICYAYYCTIKVLETTAYNL